jgi:hypothetical protein
MTNSDSFNGYNGVRVFTAKDVPVGTVPGEPYGYKRALTVTVDVRMERLTRRDSYETTTHTQVRRPLDFAITTSVWRPDGRDIVAGGATVEPLRELTTYRNGFTAEIVAELLELEPWHLNGMTAACEHQIGDVLVYEDDKYSPNGKRISTSKTVCPVTGYKYGHAWLVRELPHGFTSRVRHIFASVKDQTRIYDAQDGESGE